MNESETEQERKVREYWTKAYDSLNNNKDSNSNKLPYKPTAVISNPPKDRKITNRDLLDLDLSRE
jgi:hypothetical protein